MQLSCLAKHNQHQPHMVHENLQAIKQRFNIIGNTPLLNRAIEIAIQVAATDLSVLITGPSGSGKESFSKIIHESSLYRHGPFMAINCSAIPEGTIDSELFGHEKGAFTGALESRKGYFEQANGGTIFLDEIGDMPLATQAKLLRVLEYGEYVRVGSSKVGKTKVRVVAATNVNLIQAIKEKKFREDLYYRLNTVPIAIPPLKERGQDIILLFNQFAHNFAAKYQRKPLELEPLAKNRLLHYSFPGNIRQLRNIVEQMALLEDTTWITNEILERYLPSEPNDMLPVLYKTLPANQQQDSLYTMLYNIQQEILALKGLIFDAIKSNVVQYAANKDITSPIAVPKQRPQLTTPSTLQSAPIGYIEGNGTNDLSIENKEQELIYQSLKKHRGNRKHAAAALGISERTLYRKIKKYTINENQFKD